VSSRLRRWTDRPEHRIDPQAGSGSPLNDSVTGTPCCMMLVSSGVRGIGVRMLQMLQRYVRQKILHIPTSHRQGFHDRSSCR